MKGTIIINSYLSPVESVRQAERLKKEFLDLGVFVEIISDGSVRTFIKEGKVTSSIGNSDFIIYLDKDKYLSLELEKSGYRLFNSHNAIRVCDDKGETYIALSGTGVNLPDTVFGDLCYDKSFSVKEEYAEEIIKKLGLPLIVKESFGSMGKGVYLAEDKKGLLSLMEKLKTRPHLYQKYLKKEKGTDIRVICIGGKAVSSIMRKNDSDFRSNVALGGKGYNYELNGDFKKTAENVAKILKLDYCGVDLLFGDDNSPFVCEVNSNAFFEETERVTGKNIAKLYAEYVLSCL